MALVPGIPEPVPYRMSLGTSPPAAAAAQTVTLEFRVFDPKTGAPVERFVVVHEKLFHLFIISQDLEYFAHVHPEYAGGGAFRLEARLPKPGVYRLLADFYPAGGTPQLIPKTLTTAHYFKPLAAAIPVLAPDLRPKSAENMKVELSVDPSQPLAGKKTMMFFRIDPAEGLEPYLGAWGHMLAASADLIDTIHEHPFLAAGPDIQFNVFFPREALYRVWVQFQRKGVVNTVAFTVPAKALR